MNLTGCGTALVTPFNTDGSLDERALRALVQWQIESGIGWLVACGTTAETPTLDEAEWLRVIRIVAETADGRVPVWAGCSHNATRDAVARAKTASLVPGVTAILTANPYYNKPTQEGQYQHFKAVARAVSLPIVVYNIPGRTGVNLDNATLMRLIEGAPNVEGVKESSGVMTQITELITQAPEGFKVYAGDDPIALAVTAVGGAGLVSVASNEIPAEMAQMVNAALANNWDIARKINHKFYRLMLANFWESNPGPVKAVLAMMGRMNDTVRLPLVPPTPATRAKLERMIGELGLLVNAPTGDGNLRMF